MEAVRINEPYIYRCHFGIIDLAIPINIDNHYIGAIMAGQIRVSDTTIHDNLEKIRTMPETLEAQIGSYIETAQEENNTLPLITYEEVKDASRMLHELCNYIVTEALTKDLNKER